MNAKRYFYLIAATLGILLLAFAYQGVVRAFKAAIVIGALYLVYRAYRGFAGWRRERREKVERIANR
ncbi:hypothetical protein [Halomonas sp. I5-271120]|uniref:hypothetical protein n=1 Tax=Halomonas sp. I5-271120 TaxID=3061632 RepID=UPI00271534BF|nr:hypothetical protein [Halomonas sp. I5-271120]